MSSIRRSPARRAVAALAALALAVVLAACDLRGPAPTEQILEASSGPFAVGSIAVPASAGFGGGTIYYPSEEDGPFGVIAVSPGFLGNQTSIGTWGPRLASHGFVTITINTTNGFILPDQRSTEQRQALTYVVSQGNTASSPIFGKVDGNRRGVAGHSMGGGGTLISAQEDPTIRAAVPFAPWNSSTNFSGVTVPTLIVACQSDAIAPVGSHASPFYDSIPASADKSYVSVAGADHFCANAPTGASNDVGKYVVAFFKRFIDGDTRYDPWVCGASRPATGPVLNEVRSTCPF
jgi:dienelactone hydrolase